MEVEDRNVTFIFIRACFIKFAGVVVAMTLFAQQMVFTMHVF